jgi:hypothetical protein
VLGDTENLTCSRITMNREAGGNVYAKTIYVGTKPRIPSWNTMKSKPWTRERING